MCDVYPSTINVKRRAIQPKSTPAKFLFLQHQNKNHLIFDFVFGRSKLTTFCNDHMLLLSISNLQKIVLIQYYTF